MNRIIRNLWLGSMVDGKNAPDGFQVLSVMWQGEPGQEHRCHKIQTTDYKTFTEYAGQIVSADGVYADIAKMDEAADWIHERVQRDEDVLVHCAYGIERAPLTVVWYLMRHHGMNLSQAYQFVEARRPEVQYRGAWLPESVKITGVLPERVKS